MAILATEKVLTLDYWKPAYKLQPGDYVFDRLGNPVQVKIVQEFRSEECFEVFFDDFLSIRGNDKMEFLVENRKHRQQVIDYLGVKPFSRLPRKKTLAELLEEDLKGTHNNYKYSIPACGPLQLPTQYYEIPPFVFAVWFISRIASGFYNISEHNFEFVKEKLESNGYFVDKAYHREDFSRRLTTIPSVEAQLKPKIPLLIPTNYLMGSPEQRLEFLSGVIHARARQYNKKANKFRYSTKNLHLFKQIQFLVESLGIKTWISHSEKHNSYRLEFKTHHIITHDQVVPKNNLNRNRRYIRRIENIVPQSCVHIETDGPDGTYLVGEGLIACR